MIATRRTRSLAVVLSCAVLCGCAARGLSVSERPQAGTVGIYRGRLAPSESPARRFRFLLFAALPDRLHAEVLSPLGTTEWILDAGAGTLAVTEVRAGVSYVGPASPADLERVLGLEMSLADLVALVLTGDGAGARYDVLRSAEPPGGLPERLAIRWEKGTLELERKGFRVAPPGAEIARGRPPVGTRVLPLADLDVDSSLGLFALPAEP